MDALPDVWKQRLLLSGAVAVGVGTVLLTAISGWLYSEMNGGPNAESLTNSYVRKDKTVLITGANGGIGLETTKTLSKLYSTVIMACRNVKNASIVANEIKQANTSYNISTNFIIEKLDLSSLNQIKQFSENLRNNHNIESIDTIICNAGVAPRRSGMQTQDGFEMATGVNHLGHMLLVFALKDLLFKNGTVDDPSRLIMTSGNIYKALVLRNKLPAVDASDKEWERVWNINDENVFATDNAYAMSKLCNIWFVQVFVKKYCSDKCVAVSLHPGVGATGLVMDRNEKGEMKPLNLIQSAILPLFRRLSDKPQQLAFTQCWLAVAEKNDIQNGGFYRGSKIAPLWQIARNEKYATRMWGLSVQLIEKHVGKLPNH